MLYTWSVTPENALTWRFRGTTASPELFMHELWQGVVAQFVAVHEQADQAEPVALVSLYKLNLGAQHVSHAALANPDFRGTTAPVWASYAMFDYGFETWPIRKIYLECVDTSAANLRSWVEGGVLHEEARFVDHERTGEGWHDLIYFTLSRSAWEEHAARLQLDQRVTIHQ